MSGTRSTRCAFGAFWSVLDFQSSMLILSAGAAVPEATARPRGRDCATFRMKTVDVAVCRLNMS